MQLHWTRMFNNILCLPSLFVYLRTEFKYEYEREWCYNLLLYVTLQCSAILTMSRWEH